jgi:exonuclease III
MYKCNLLKLSGDIESNPGPNKCNGLLSKTELQITTQNCRGLNNRDKLRVVLNKCYSILRQTPSAIIMLQETMIDKDDALKYMWRGQYVFTPGAGNARGCLTLLSHDAIIENIQHVEDRAHIFRLKLPNIKNHITIANIYAPTTRSVAKLEFFSNIERTIIDTKEMSDDLIIGGDFNTPLYSYEVHNRSFDRTDQKQAQEVSKLIERLNIQDCWINNKQTHTWTSRNCSSRLDRVLYDFANLRLLKCETDWTTCKSDHAAIHVTFSKDRHTDPTPTHKAVYLNTEMIKNPETAQKIRRIFREKLAEAIQEWNPHTKLEYAKMIIRSTAIEEEKALKKRENNLMNTVTDEINHLVQVLQDDSLTIEDTGRIKGKLQSYLFIRDNILQEKGKILAQKTKSRWYNEGEQSNKYFLNLLKRQSKATQISELRIDGVIVDDPKIIKEEVTKFYRNLYNQNLSGEIKDETFRFSNMVSLEEARKVTEEITKHELLNTLKGTKDSTPGPDGIPYSYIKLLWDDFSGVLLEAWRYSIETNKLSESHSHSILKLLPKAGKDLKELKNWRPITLSNCDFKLITKTYANRLTKAVGEKLSNTQTAYLKGRQIHDNIRLIKSSITYGKNNGLIVALDAKKAFDSVRHEFIIKALEKQGLGNFVSIFQLMYKDAITDLLINKQFCNGFKILNGVKQGDALSCILFIMAIDPLMQNIENNPRIKALAHQESRYEWPKAFGYADDITLVIQNDYGSVKTIFQEYEAFSLQSGLFLNAEKTEIFSILETHRAQFTVRYNNESATINIQDEIKINGIQLARSLEEIRNLNLISILEKIDKQFRLWSIRNLSLLGKIQIIKTFGMSQIFYSASSLTFTETQHKQIRERIFKFLWTKNYLGNKAPDRIARETIRTATENGGFGLVDHERICESINAKQYLKIQDEKYSHPIKLLLLQNHRQSYYNREIPHKIDDVTCLGAKIVNRLIENYLAYTQEENLREDRISNHIFNNEKLKNIVKPQHKNSLTLLLMQNVGITSVNQMTQQYLNSFCQLLTETNKKMLQVCWQNRIQGNMFHGDQTELDIFRNKLPTKCGRFKNSWFFTSRLIRINTDKEENKLKGKIVDVPEQDITDTFKTLKRLKCTRQKNTYLRIYHGDVYTKEKLFRFGLIDSPNCPRCNVAETRMHLLYECPYTLSVWRKLNQILADQQQQPTLEQIMGIGETTNELKVRIELMMLLINPDRPTIATVDLILIALNKIEALERSEETKKFIGDLKNKV